MNVETPAPGPGRSSGLVVDRLRWWDLDQVQVLETALFPDAAWTPGQFWSELARVPESRWYVAARRDNRVVGYAGIFLTGPEADVQTLAVAPSEQGRGTGRTLMEVLADRARERGANVLHLEVRADNLPALGLYARLGFEVDGRRRGYYSSGGDATLMSLDLRDRSPADGGPVTERGRDHG